MPQFFWVIVVTFQNQGKIFSKAGIDVSRSGRGESFGSVSAWEWEMTYLGTDLT